MSCILAGAAGGHSRFEHTKSSLQNTIGVTNTFIDNCDATSYLDLILYTKAFSEQRKHRSQTLGSGRKARTLRDWADGKLSQRTAEASYDGRGIPLSKQLVNFLSCIYDKFNSRMQCNLPTLSHGHLP
jgi:hypothetical protein